MCAHITGYFFLDAHIDKLGGFLMKMPLIEKIKDYIEIDQYFFHGMISLMIFYRVWVNP